MELYEYEYSAWNNRTEASNGTQDDDEEDDEEE